MDVQEYRIVSICVPTDTHCSDSADTEFLEPLDSICGEDLARGGDDCCRLGAVRGFIGRYICRQPRHREHQECSHECADRLRGQV